ncbi:DUF6442 family protein [uncultured Parolsenella sp.]|uniref:DUF6442 family protein n=1 Tax=uncultured Parolsenella sp. TaxID=2083008 RepID=UPI0027D9BA7F|nr:DUF6442 family protein [uncultured Parolsenella sp.]
MDKKEILFRNRLDNGGQGEYERDVLRRGERWGGFAMAAVLTLLVGYRALTLGWECHDLFALTFASIAGRQTYMALKLRGRALVVSAVLSWMLVVMNLALYFPRA